MRSDRDPFEGLCLDESFVRAARFIEPSAADRSVGAGTRRSGRSDVVPVRRGLPALIRRLVRVPSPRRRSRASRARVLTALALALGLVSLGVLFARQYAGRGGQGASVANPAADPAIEVTPTSLFGGGSVGVGTARATASAVPRELAGFVVPASVAVAADLGDCLTWAPAGADRVVVREVGCGEPHRGEVTRIIELARRFPVWPGDDPLDDVLATECAAALPERLGAGSSNIAARPSSLHASHAGWKGDARVLVCIVGDGRGGEWSGSVRGVDVAA